MKCNWDRKSVKCRLSCWIRQPNWQPIVIAVPALATNLHRCYVHHKIKLTWTHWWIWRWIFKLTVNGVFPFLFILNKYFKQWFKKHSAVLQTLYVTDVTSLGLTTAQLKFFSASICYVCQCHKCCLRVYTVLLTLYYLLPHWFYNLRC